MDDIGVEDVVRQSLKKRRLDVSKDASVIVVDEDDDEVKLMPDGRRRDRVVIIGAGAAGLAAASKLQKSARFDVIVLEGRNRTGGRIYTIQNDGVPVDMGAEFTIFDSYSSIPDPIRHLCPNESLQRRFTTRLYNRNGPIRSDAKQGGRRWYEMAHAAIQRGQQACEVGDNNDESVQALLDKFLSTRMLAQFERGVLQWYLTLMETMSHGDLRFLSLRNWDVAMEPKEQFQTGEGSKCLREGGRTVVDVLSEGLNVQMGEVVTEVRYDTGGVNVFTKGGATVSADRCIVTVPIGVLKSDALEFHPELPERKRKAIQQIGVTTMNKLLLRFEEAFWPEEEEDFAFVEPEEDEGEVRPSGDFYLFHSPTRLREKGMLIAFSYGEAAEQLETCTDEDMTERATEVLKKIFPGKYQPPVWQSISKWRNDEFSKGTYPFLPVNQSPKEFEVMAESVDDRIFFAGDATTSVYSGTVRGAYLSGIREADKVLACARVSCAAEEVIDIDL